MDEATFGQIMNLMGQKEALLKTMVELQRKVKELDEQIKNLPAPPPLEDREK